jgi:hypothetical protein
MGKEWRGLWVGSVRTGLGIKHATFPSGLIKSLILLGNKQSRRSKIKDFTSPGGPRIHVLCSKSFIYNSE